MVPTVQNWDGLDGWIEDWEAEGFRPEWCRSGGGVLTFWSLSVSREGARWCVFARSFDAVDALYFDSESEALLAARWLVAVAESSAAYKFVGRRGDLPVGAVVTSGLRRSPGEVHPLWAQSSQSVASRVSTGDKP